MNPLKISLSYFFSMTFAELVLSALAIALGIALVFGRPARKPRISEMLKCIGIVAPVLGLAHAAGVVIEAFYSDLSSGVAFARFQFSTEQDWLALIYPFCLGLWVCIVAGGFVFLNCAIELFLDSASKRKTQP